MTGDEMNESALLLLGEIKGQMRELIQGVNSTNAKVDALSLRVAHLEASENERKGERNIITLFLKSPAVAWIAAGLAAAWAYLKSVSSS